MNASPGDEVIVIGAGIVGICTALSLQERGLAVRLIDRDEPGQATSYGNAGIISPWSIVPQFLPGFWKNVPRWLIDRDGPLRFRLRDAGTVLPWAARVVRNASLEKVTQVSSAMELLCAPCVELYRKHLAGTGHEDLVADSYYVQVFRRARDANIDGLDYRLRRERGAVIEKIGAPELRRLEPAVAPGFEAAVLIGGQARARSPGRIARVLAEKAKARGAAIVEGEVKRIRPDGSGRWQVDLQGRSFASDRVVVSAGAWSAALLKALGQDLPLIAERGYHLQFPDPGIALNHSIMDVERKFVASTMLEGLRVAGTSEFAALDAPPSRQRYRSLMRSARRLLPEIETGGAREWMGARPSLPDGLPVLGEYPGAPGLFGAFGHCHYGLMMAPKSGEVVADLIAGRKVNVDLSAFRADRF